MTREGLQGLLEHDWEEQLQFCAVLSNMNKRKWEYEKQYKVASRCETELSEYVLFEDCSQENRLLADRSTAGSEKANAEG